MTDLNELNHRIRNERAKLDDAAAVHWRGRLSACVKALFSISW